MTMLPQRLVCFVQACRRLRWALASSALFLACMFRYWVSYDPNASVVRTQESASIAFNFIESHQFANPFYLLNTGPSAHLAPAFPIFMALVFKTFGVHAAGAFALQLMAVLTVSIQVALFPFFSSRLGMGQINGFLGACFWIVAKPILIAYWEAYYAALLISVACCVYRRYLNREARGPGWGAWLLGILMGLLILMTPTLAPVLAAGLAWEIWRRKSAFLRESFLPLVLLPALIVSPWLIRNYLVFHHLMIRDNFGLELSISNNDCAQFSLRRNMDSGCSNKMHPEGSLNQARKVLELGEVRYNGLRLKEALQWIEGHPERFASLTGMRFIAFWFPTESGTIHYAGTGRRLERVVIYLMTLLSFYGLVILYRRDIKSAAICVSCLALYPLVYYVIQYIDRYRCPILWLTFLLGALPITKFVAQKFSLTHLNFDPSNRSIESSASRSLD
jgi:hypothetical protein